ncbi:hypothetical protein BD779DRAFT_1789862 [Infundibulicybe gibba]|nr:hypothetical protein BD779DRAFT_1789862 [Infundibulicybe gibba]
MMMPTTRSNTTAASTTWSGAIRQPPAAAKPSSHHKRAESNTAEVPVQKRPRVDDGSNNDEPSKQTGGEESWGNKRGGTRGRGSRGKAPGRITGAQRLAADAAAEVAGTPSHLTHTEARLKASGIAVAPPLRVQTAGATWPHPLAPLGIRDRRSDLVTADVPDTKRGSDSDNTFSATGRHPGDEPGPIPGSGGEDKEEDDDGIKGDDNNSKSDNKSDNNGDNKSDNNNNKSNHTNINNDNDNDNDNESKHKNSHEYLSYIIVNPQRGATQNPQNPVKPIKSIQATPKVPVILLNSKPTKSKKTNKTSKSIPKIQDVDMVDMVDPIDPIDPIDSPSSPPSPPRAFGASRTEGGIFRGKAFGNTSKLSDYPELEPQGKVRVYLSNLDPAEMVPLEMRSSFSMNHPVVSNAKPVLQALKNRIFIMDDDEWSPMGRFEKAIGFDDPISWSIEGNNQVLHLLLSSFDNSGPDPSVVARPDQDLWAEMFEIDIQFRIRAPGTLFSAYAKYKAYQLMINDLNARIACGDWVGRRPVKRALVEIFISHSIWQKYYEKTFPYLSQHANMVAWLEIEEPEDAKVNTKVWGVTQMEYGFLDLIKWLANGGTLKMAKGKAKEIDETRSHKKGGGGSSILWFYLLSICLWTMRTPVALCILTLIFMVPGVNAASMQDSFPNVTFKAFNQFVNANFDTKVSLATVLIGGEWCSGPLACCSHKAAEGVTSTLVRFPPHPPFGGHSETRRAGGPTAQQLSRQGCQRNVTDYRVDTAMIIQPLVTDTIDQKITSAVTWEACEISRSGMIYWELQRWDQYLPPLGGDKCGKQFTASGPQDQDNQRKGGIRLPRRSDRFPHDPTYPIFPRTPPFTPTHDSRQRKTS